MLRLLLWPTSTGSRTRRSPSPQIHSAFLGDTIGEGEWQPHLLEMNRMLRFEGSRLIFVFSAVICKLYLNPVQPLLSLRMGPTSTLSFVLITLPMVIFRCPSSNYVTIKMETDGSTEESRSKLPLYLKLAFLAMEPSNWNSFKYSFILFFYEILVALIKLVMFNPTCNNQFCNEHPIVILV